MRPIHTLVWHCTATPEGKEFTRAQIKAMHLARGFSDIGYHKLIHLDGSISEGRSEEIVGAHVAGHNTGSIGYSYVGGVTAANKPKDTRTPAQKATMTRLTGQAIARYGLKTVVGHRDLSPDKDGDGQVEPHEWVKSCPCFDARAEFAPLLAPGRKTAPPPAAPAPKPAAPPPAPRPAPPRPSPPPDPAPQPAPTGGLFGGLFARIRSNIQRGL